MRQTQPARPRLAPKQAAGGDGPRAPLRLTVTRGALGLELYEPIELGPLSVARLALTLPGLQFPLDLSGGVPKFRNRRGELQSAELRLDLGALASWLTPRWSSLLGGLIRPVSVWARLPTLGFGLVGHEGALAFNLVWAPVAGDARFVVVEARGGPLKGSPLSYALQAVDTAGRGWLERSGRILTVKSAVSAVVRATLPNLGARVPRVNDLRLGELENHVEQLRVLVDSAIELPRPSPELLRSLELAQLSREADDALASGALDHARALYLSALERAPRQPELARRAAEIDALAGGRADAALGLLRECLPLEQGGMMAAELLAQAGELAQARDVVAATLLHEPFGPLAALGWHWLAERESSGAQRLSALDNAVARAPSLQSVRWSRFHFRAERGDVEGALADAEHLEAAESGARERHLACRQAARILAEAGFVREAGRLFERALRYLPDDALCTAGLARAFLELGKRDRALVLLDRAIVLSERDGQGDPSAVFDLACLLADYLHDYPQAIARMRQVSASAPKYVEARALEATWRAKLGDIVGASLAYARLRDAVELAPATPPAAADWLLEAAHFERDVKRDALAAERHLLVALRLRPGSQTLLEAYREVGALVAQEARVGKPG